LPGNRGVQALARFRRPGSRRFRLDFLQFRTQILDLPLKVGLQLLNLLLQGRGILRNGRCGALQCAKYRKHE
jgi:hypothetical protein